MRGKGRPNLGSKIRFRRRAGAERGWAMGTRRGRTWGTITARATVRAGVRVRVRVRGTYFHKPAHSA